MLYSDSVIHTLEVVRGNGSGIESWKEKKREFATSS